MLNEKLLDILSHLAEGAVTIVTPGDDFDHMKAKFSWARAALEIAVTTAKQMM